MAQAVLLVIIINMVTISIHPYSPRKIGLVALTLLSLSCFSVLAQSNYISVNSTPYDRQMIRVRSVLTAAPQEKQQRLSLAMVNHWMGNLRSIPYGFSMEWKTPDEVQFGAFADCKGKSVALYNAMHSRGAENIRLVIGKRSSTSRKTHAWLEWTMGGATYILDPTINWSAFRTEQTRHGSYIPLYAYAGTRKYRAIGGSGLLASNRSLNGHGIASRL